MTKTIEQTFTRDSIRYWNRAAGREEEEQVYGEGLINLLYGTYPGQLLADGLLCRKFPSQLYGAFQSAALSRGKIAPFIRDFRIPMEEYEDPGFRCFNDFFIRKFKPGARTFEAEASRMPAFAEARYLAFERIQDQDLFPVKGTFLAAEAMLGGPEKAAPFVGGPLLLARLCPTDYHRFHFPDDGTVLEHFPVAGKLHSVNPRALKYKGEILSTNERYVTLLQTRNFGKLAYVEVGALCVGRIVQTHPLAGSFRRGEEKGYFLFGGSTVIVLGEKGAWTPDSDLLEQTRQRRETLVRLGDGVALQQG